MFWALFVILVCYNTRFTNWACLHLQIRKKDGDCTFLGPLQAVSHYHWTWIDQCFQFADVTPAGLDLSAMVYFPWDIDHGVIHISVTSPKSLQF